MSALKRHLCGREAGARNRPGGTAREAPSAEEIQGWLTLRIAEELGVEPDEIRADVPLDRYGLDSRIVAGIAADLEDWLRRPLEATLLWDYATIAAVSQHLGGSPLERRAAGASRE